MRKVAATLCLLSAMLALSITTARAGEGDVLRCVVADFRYGGPDDGPDPAFEAVNRAKIFDIVERRDRFTVIMHSDQAEPATNEYMIIERTGVSTIAAEAPIVFSKTLVVSDDPDPRDGQIKATIVLQGESFVNIWYLDCAPSK